MKLTAIHAPVFDLALTLDSGQTFHWQQHGGGFVGTIGSHALYVEQRGDELLVSSGFAAEAAHYFALDHALDEICRLLPKDPAMAAAGDYCRGLRIMRQPIWECLAAFITSSMKQVAHIRQMSRALRERFGTRLDIGEIHVFAFPPAERLAAASEQELRACGLGYRAKNLLATARAVADGAAEIESWRSLPDEELRSRLCELPGVGAKVANCVMLFAYERLRAFPIDVWIERVLKQQYFPRARKLTPQRLREFCDSYFGEHGGYAQQYLFHHARKTTPRARKPAAAKPRHKLSQEAGRDKMRRVANA